MIIDVRRNNGLSDLSEDQLILQGIGLSEMVRVLKDHSIPFFLSGGTLLGAIRHGDFIPWDWDVEVSADASILYEKCDTLIDRFSSVGFVVRGDFSLENFKLVLERYNTKYEVIGYLRFQDQMIRRNWRVPARFFENPEFVELRGERYPVLSPPLEYLEFFYGDWQTIKRTRSKNFYTSKQCRIGSGPVMSIYGSTIKKLSEIFGFFKN